MKKEKKVLLVGTPANSLVVIKVPKTLYKQIQEILPYLDHYTSVEDFVVVTLYERLDSLLGGGFV